METIILQGLCRDYIGGYIGIIENRTRETTIQGLGFWGLGLQFSRAGSQGLSFG